MVRATISFIIGNCWHGRHKSVAQLSGDVASLDGHSWQVVKEDPSVSEAMSMKHECEMLAQNGLLEQLFTC